MIDNITLLIVHIAIGILVWRLIRTPDPDATSAERPSPMQRLRRRPGADG